MNDRDRLQRRNIGFRGKAESTHASKHTLLLADDVRLGRRNLKSLNKTRWDNFLYETISRGMGIRDSFAGTAPSAQN